ncbi:MAG TPA: DUF389 domain-containing protein [Streptosporangiaceae bacterium]|jgi:uncharacterized hydrophobic protein (TIGR00271 family)
MLHVRLASPPDLTPRVTGLLTGDPGVTNLVVLPGASREPAGDAVQFDLSTAAANPVLRDLRALGGIAPVCMELVDATIGAPGFDRPRRGSYHGETAPVWPLVESKIAAESVYPPSFFALLALAAMIGAVGILTNSTILIVGAMVVGPEYNAILAVAHGLERRDLTAVRRGLLALAAGFAIAIVVTLLFSLIIRASGNVPKAYELGVRPASSFIASPDMFSVIVAVLAGIIGVVSLTEARGGALIGVFISVTTIPAAADIGLSLAFGDWHDTSGAVFQLLLNVFLLTVVGLLALHAQRAFWRDRGS